MPTTVQQVKDVGGLNHADDYLLFRVANTPALDDLIEDAIDVAAAWLRTRLPSGIYATSDTDIQTLLALGEAYLALHFLAPHAKARKVYGTHFAFDSEDSERYEELIDVEWLKLMEDLLGEWLDVSPTGSFARPRLRVGAVIDRNDLQSVEEEFAETLDHVRSLSVALP